MRGPVAEADAAGSDPHTIPSPRYAGRAPADVLECSSARLVGPGWARARGPLHNMVARLRALAGIDGRGAHARRRTFAAVALPDEAPQQVRAVVAVRGLVEGLLREGVGLWGRGRGLRHGGREGRAELARYSCRGARGRAAFSERLSRPTIAARLPPALRRPPPHPAPRPRTLRAPERPSARPATQPRAVGRP